MSKEQKYSKRLPWYILKYISKLTKGGGGYRRYVKVKDAVLPYVSPELYDEAVKEIAKRLEV